MLVGRGTSWLAIAAAASAALLLTLAAAIVASRGQLRIALIGYGRSALAVGARDGGVALQLRWRHTLRAGDHRPAGWRAFTSSADAPLEAMCIRTIGDGWVLPGLWLGAGRDTYVHGVDVLLPPWLTIPSCLLFPALWYHRRRHRQSRGFAALPVPPAPPATASASKVHTESRLHGP